MSIIQRRQLFMAIHRYAGLVILAFLAIAGLTGCILCFDKPLDRVLNPERFHPKAAGLIAPPAAVAALEGLHPQIVATYFPVRATPGQNILVRVAARPGSKPLAYDEMFLDAGDGRLVGTRLDGAGWDRPHLMRGVYELHCDLVAGTIGRWIMGIAALLWLIGNLIGVYITLPLRGPYLRRWRQAWVFKPSRTLRQTLLDLHRTCGLWLLVPLSVLAFTSAAMNFYGEVLTPAVQALSPPGPSPFDQAPPAVPPSRRPGFDMLLARAERLAAARGLAWKPAVLQEEADRGLFGVRFTRSGYEEYRGLGPVTYWFDDGGRFVYADDPYRDSTGMAVERSLYPLHTGEMVGWPGVALDLVLGLVTTMLSLSGLYLWLKRRQGQRLARERARQRATATSAA